MAETGPRKRRKSEDRTSVRALAVAGLAGLLVVLVVVVTMIGGAAGDEGDEAAAPEATAVVEPEETAKPKPTTVPLTAEEKAERQEAIDLVASRSFEVVDRDDWNPDDTLQVLIGQTSDGNELAFWFVDGTYLGNDSTDLSTRIRVKATDGVQVTLRYSIYDLGADDSGKPTADPIDIDFRYEAGVVEPVEALPSAEQRLQ